MLLQPLREELCKMHLELPRQGLVTWTSGNISVLDDESALMVIKPSGLLFEELTPESMVVLDLDGKVIEGKYKPSSDTATHAYIYRHMPHVRINHPHPQFVRDLMGGE